MSAVDTVARAEIAQTKVQLHQMTTALLKTAAALDNAFQAIERILPLLTEGGGLSAEQAEAERRLLQSVRGEILGTRLYLHKNPGNRGG
jgi:hypothetical protein